ncbi:DEAD/DEAH box helicase [Pannus brasiliensis CCIBt3594]|uniref:DEAD/DEAH box helicase n=1 Tax=Pannus brasiliensis CCIBt3594 TaxID=1427578 RepID=A0AAW9QZA6_9CHRO
MNDLDRLRDQLIGRYRELPAIERAIVRLFSVIYESVARTSFLECFNQTAYRDERNRLFNVSSLKPHIDRLVEAGILLQEKGYGPRCHPLLVEIATRDSIAEGEFESFAAIIKRKLPQPRARWDKALSFDSPGQLIREARLSIYRRDLESLEKLIEDYRKTSYSDDHLYLLDIIVLVCENPFDLDWFRTQPKELQALALTGILVKSFGELANAEAAFSRLEEICQEDPTTYEICLWTEQAIERGQFEKAGRYLDRSFSDPLQAEIGSLRGWLAFIKGENARAIEEYSVALKTLKKTTGKQKIYFPSLSGLFFIFALLKEGTPERIAEAAEYTSWAIRNTEHPFGEIYSRLQKLIAALQGDTRAKDAVIDGAIAPHEVSHCLETLLCSMCLYWMDAHIAKKHLPRLLLPLYEDAKRSGYHWLARETGALLFRLDKTLAVEVVEDRDLPSPLVDTIQPREPWELSLSALANLRAETPSAGKSSATLRLAWFITLYSGDYLLQPKEQKLDARGSWSRGRPVALKRLRKAGELDYLTPQDLKVCGHIEVESGYYGQTEYRFDRRAIVDLVGHPLVFWEDSAGTRLEIVGGEPELRIAKQKSGKLILSLSPDLSDREEFLLIKETPTRLKVIEVKPEHRRIADIIGKTNRLEVPESAREKVLTAINAVSGLVTVHSDIGGGVAAREVEADSKPRVHLLPAGEGLKVSVLTRPFAGGGPYFRPGKGGETVIAEIDGERVQTKRDLALEKSLARTAIDACPTLISFEEEHGEWLIENPEDCLELLLELRELSDNVVLEWPEGEKWRVTRQAGLKDLHLKIQSQRDWFAVSGELRLDEKSVLSMQELMKLLEGSPGRFIALGDGQFLALTEAFRERLAELRSFSEKSGDGFRFHPLVSPVFADLTEEVGELKTDKRWRENLQKFRESQDFTPELPSTLQAELRDYQLDGFRWLARLARWGAGACLADDMGLGKTLQALAVILARAPEGPTLAIAPTSVCLNWIAEAERFAPTLNIVQLGTGDRQGVIDRLQPFDLLVCSYGLLQQEEVATMLAGVEWRTIVLDEAQAIKNFSTKRSKAAMSLQGDFKMIATGTPIENHLGELWNLFRFINPGLLGSQESFDRRFATPIEKYNDRTARESLRKLVRPFLLRRTKNQVLAELPPRTEILVPIELSVEEKAFYEALRRQAVERLSESDSTAGAKHLQVLAEIMKLRRACCHPKLVMPDMDLPGSKLTRFGEVLDELLENHHKALVFSQFVDHLSIVRDYLDKREIKYQYLDGSTPASDRQKRVKAFQAGEGDVFLISLKAGGTGLNLTAADYVIHLDPWWNPAVEDQASDRAHRIGQKRPVTIYRLVAKDSIEEKIVDLHHHKRDLADSLLEGTDASGKLSTEELLQLIAEG